MPPKGKGKTPVADPTSSSSTAAIPPLEVIESQEPYAQPSTASELTDRYEPYDIANVRSYTDDQILHYVHSNQITDFEAFIQAKQERDNAYRQLGIPITLVGEAPARTPANEEVILTPRTPTAMPPPIAETNPAPIPVAPRPVPVARSVAQSVNSLDDDGEPDMTFPQPTPGEKGVKIDRQPTLHHNGGLLDHENWLSGINRIFRADKARFNDAVKRIAFAVSTFDKRMESIWTNDSRNRPILEEHWIKFLRWVDRTHLHGESDTGQQLRLYEEARQGQNEEPSSFYSRLSSLALAARTTFDHRGFFGKLNDATRSNLMMSHRIGNNMDELLESAQEVWAAHRILRPGNNDNSTQNGQNKNQKKGNNQRGNGRKNNGNKTPNKPNSNHRLSDEEQKRRAENHLCFNCGRPGHMSTNCRSAFNPDPPPGTSNQSTTPARNQNAVSRQGSHFRGNRYKGGGKKKAAARAQPLEIADDERVEELSTDDDEAEEEPQPKRRKSSKN